jgi:hypothetical protein
MAITAVIYDCSRHMLGLMFVLTGCASTPLSHKQDQWVDI